MYDFTGFKDEYARKKAERADALENEAQAAKIRADWNQYAARQTPAAQPIQATSMQDALDQAVYSNPAAQQQLKLKSLIDQISDSILAGVHGQEQMDRYTASGMTLPSALVKEGLAGAQSVVFGTPYQFGIKPDAQEGFTARPFIDLYMTQLEELAKRDPLRGLNSQNPSQFQIMHDWLAETPAAQTILGAIGEIAVDPLTYIGADTIMGIADAVKAGKTAQALTILKDVEAAAQAERAAAAGTKALDAATDIARGADQSILMNNKIPDAGDIYLAGKEGKPGVKVEDIISPNGSKTPGAAGHNVHDSTEKVRIPEQPNPSSLSDIDTRRWYLDAEAKIPDLIDKTKSLEQQAKQAFELRNQFRTQARAAMKNRDVAQDIEIKDPNLSWEQIIQKYTKKGFTGDALYEEIIKASTRSRTSINESLGIYPRKD